MSHPPPDRVVADLEQRIGTVEALGDKELGRFTHWDWLLVILGAVVVPAILLWWFAG